jgi:hypothetical protein
MGRGEGEWGPTSHTSLGTLTLAGGGGVPGLGVSGGPNWGDEFALACHSSLPRYHEPLKRGGVVQQAEGTHAVRARRLRFG